METSARHRTVFERQSGSDSRLGIDLKSFKKVPGASELPRTSDIDEDAGSTIDVNGHGGSETVRGYIYRPAAKYNQLRCRESK